MGYQAAGMLDWRGYELNGTDRGEADGILSETFEGGQESRCQSEPDGRENVGGRTGKK